MAFVPATAESIFRNHEDSHFPTSSPCAPQEFHGVSELLMRRSVSFSGMDRAEELQPEDDMSDDGSQLLGEKKRRLNMEQVKVLEKSFELGNKLEPERKMQLARALGLQPRQIAIWFQNRRARWKTKQLEKDYDILKRQFESLKADNDALKSQNKNLKKQLLALKTRESTGSGAINLNKDNIDQGSLSNGSEHSCEVNLNTTSTDSTVVYPHHQSDVVKHATAVSFPPAISLTQLLHSSDHLQICQKIDHNAAASNETFCNVFGGIEGNPDFWPWPEQQNFH